MLRQIPGPSTSSQPIRRAAQRALAVATLALASAALVGCPGTSTVFIDEGPGQQTDRASGKAPAGTLGACKVRGTKRPPIVNKTLWEHLKVCTSKTPRRYVQIGYSRDKGLPIEAQERRLNAMMQGLQLGRTDPQGNVKLLGAIRALHQDALSEPALANRVERDTARLQACDYVRFLNTAESRRKESKDSCPIKAYDPEARTEVCMLESSVPEGLWLTAGWDCLAFTGTVGEGDSCHRLCNYDDYCAAQSSCTANDFSLVMCALGVCLPDKVAGIL